MNVLTEISEEKYRAQSEELQSLKNLLVKHFGIPTGALNYQQFAEIHFKFINQRLAAYKILEPHMETAMKTVVAAHDSHNSMYKALSDRAEQLREAEYLRNQPSKDEGGETP